MTITRKNRVSFDVKREREGEERKRGSISPSGGEGKLYEATRDLEIYKEKEEVDLATSDQKVERSAERGM